MASGNNGKCETCLAEQAHKELRAGAADCEELFPRHVGQLALCGEHRELGLEHVVIAQVEMDGDLLVEFVHVTKVPADEPLAKTEDAEDILLSACVGNPQRNARTLRKLNRVRQLRLDFFGRRLAKHTALVLTVDSRRPVAHPSRGGSTIQVLEHRELLGGWGNRRKKRTWKIGV